MRICCPCSRRATRNQHASAFRTYGVQQETITHLLSVLTACNNEPVRICCPCPRCAMTKRRGVYAFCILCLTGSKSTFTIRPTQTWKMHSKRSVCGVSTVSSPRLHTSFNILYLLPMSRKHVGQLQSDGIADGWPKNWHSRLRGNWTFDHPSISSIILRRCSMASRTVSLSR